MCSVPRNPEKLNRGWYPRRRDILKELEEGQVSLLDVAIHDVLSLWADWQTGISWASAEKIKALCPADFSYKSIQRSLVKLERLGWIKRFLIRGRRGNYPTLVCRYLVRDASMTWLQTSGEKTADWRNVQFDPVHDESFNRPQSSTRAVHEVAHEVSGIQEVRIENEEKRAAAPRAAFSDSIWNFLNIEPCGPKSFQSRLQDSWASRDTKRLESDVIGASIDAHEETVGKKLAAPRLFRALGDLRERERQSETLEAEKNPNEGLELTESGRAAYERHRVSSFELDRIPPLRRG